MTKTLVRGRSVLCDIEQSPDGGVLADGAVLVDGAFVVELGDFAILKAENPDAVVIGSDESIVIPGLVNAHTHGRGLPTVALGIPDGQVDPFLVDFMTTPPLDAYLDTIYANLRLLGSGVTTVVHSAMIRNPGHIPEEAQDTIRSYRDCGMKVAYAAPLQDIPGLIYRGETEFLDGLPEPLQTKIKAILMDPDAGYANPAPGLEAFKWALDAYKDDDAVRILAGPQGPEWATDDLWRQILDLCDQYDVGIHTHCSESAAQRDASYSVHGVAPVERLHRLGVLGPGTTLVHCVWTDPAEQALLAETGTNVVTNTSCNLRLSQGLAPIAQIHEQGINVALGTDSFTIAGDEDFLAEIRLANTVHRMPRGLGITSYPSNADTLAMATVNGAKVGQFNTGVGRLAAGGPADLVVLDGAALGGPFMAPGVPVADALIAYAQRGHVRKVMIDGLVVFDEGTYTTVDYEAVCRELAAVAAREPDTQFAEFSALIKQLLPHAEALYRDWDYGFTPSPAYVPNTGAMKL